MDEKQKQDIRVILEQFGNDCASILNGEPWMSYTDRASFDEKIDEAIKQILEVWTRKEKL